MSYSPENAGLLRAFFLSVFGSAAAVAVVFTAFFVATSLGSELYLKDFVGMFIASFIVAALVIAIVSTVVGLPLTFLLEHYRLERNWTYPLAGFVIGALLVIGLNWLSGSMETASEALFSSAWGGLPGGFCGAIWWFSRRSLLAVKRDGSWT